MTQNLKRIKKIGNHDKLPVFGYIRKSQNELTFLTIPMLIYYLCLAYYFHEEYFEKCTNNMKISKDKMSMIHSKEISYLKYGYVWCKQCIDSQIHLNVKWKIKIDRKCRTISIRIASHERDVGTNEHPVYDIGFEFKQDDILTIALNTRERRFKVTNNGKMKIVRYLIKVGPAIKYKLCIKSDSVGNSVSLLDFSSDTIPI